MQARELQGMGRAELRETERELHCPRTLRLCGQGSDLGRGEQPGFEFQPGPACALPSLLRCCCLHSHPGKRAGTGAPASPIRSACGRQPQSHRLGLFLCCANDAGQSAPGSGQEPCRGQEGSTGLCSLQHKHLSSRLFPELASCSWLGWYLGHVRLQCSQARICHRK